MNYVHRAEKGAAKWKLLNVINVPQPVLVLYISDLQYHNNVLMSIQVTLFFYKNKCRRKTPWMTMGANNGKCISLSILAACIIYNKRDSSLPSYKPCSDENNV